ncbi:hypothetical protein BGW38_000829, partial [Lunasporangiospora selenospora]
GQEASSKESQLEPKPEQKSEQEPSIREQRKHFETYHAVYNKRQGKEPSASRQQQAPKPESQSHS